MQRLWRLILNKSQGLLASHRARRDVYESRREVERYLTKNPVLPTRIHGIGDDIAISAIFKDEAPYIEEWINFHRSIGFNRFFLYDNGSTDNGPALAQDCSRNGDVHVITWNTFSDKFNAQILAYSHAVCNFGPKCAWMTFIDIDEFLFPIDDAKIGSVLSKYNDVPSVAIPWHMYGTSGHRTPPSGGVLRNFVHRRHFPPHRAEAELLLKYKTIFQPHFLQAVHPHLPIIRNAQEFFYTEEKIMIPRKLRYDPTFAHSTAFRLNHYFTKDEQTMRHKSKKGRASLTKGAHKNKIMIKRAEAIGEGDVYDPIAFDKALLCGLAIQER